MHKALLTKDDAKFIFEQAEKMLKDSVETSNIIASRTNTLITIITGCLIAFISYLITRLISLTNRSNSLLPDVLIESISIVVEVFTVSRTLLTVQYLYRNMS